MQLTPRYGPDPVLHLDGEPSAVGELVVRQRRRFGGVLADLTAPQWDHATRCDEWSAKDVAVHLATANGFWDLSIRSGISGQPTRFMAEFDPAVTPDQMVSAAEMTTEEIVAAMADSADELEAYLDGLSPADWTSLAESPPGHVSVSDVLHHALWDAWIHERDILLPLGVQPAEEPDEVLACLRYVAGLTPALVLISGVARTGGFDVAPTDLDAAFHVEIGENVSVTEGAHDAGFTLTGRAADLVDALSLRRPLDQEIPDDLTWAFGGLSAAFDR